MRVITKEAINKLQTEIRLATGCHDRQLAVDILLSDLSAVEFNDLLINLKEPVMRPIRGLDL